MKTTLFKLWLCAIIACLPIIANAYDMEIDGIYYNFNTSSKEATVTYKTTSYNSYSGPVVVPETVTYNGKTYSVTSIGEGAFRNCTGLTSVTIPNSVKSIGDYGDYAFSGCTGLKEVHISDLAAWCGISFNSNLSNPLFYAHHLYLNGEEVTDLVIPNSVTSIGRSAFYYCTGLTSVTIPNRVTSIGVSAFERCTGLTSVTIPNSVTSIGGGAFSVCSGLTSVTINSNAIASKSYSYSSTLANIFGTQVENYVFGDGVKSIGQYACYNCSGLTTVTIHESVVSISGWAFLDCNGLKEVHITNLAAWCGISFNSNPLSYAHHLYLNGEEVKDLVIPNSVTSIVGSAFSGCSGLTSVTIGNSVSSIGDYAFYRCTGLTSVTIPHSVTSIGNDAFYNCTGLTSVTIPNSVTSIGNDAFVRCTGLTSITIGNNVTSIGNYAFYGCEKLKFAFIPDGVKTIEASTFEGCKRMTEVRIGTGVESIENRAFNGCSLVRIYNYAEFPQDCGSNVFSIVKSNCKLYVMEDSQDLYRVHKDWYEFDIQPMDAEALPVEAIEDGNSTISSAYDLNGRKLSQPKKGLNIIRFSDGTTKKVMIK